MNLNKAIIIGNLTANPEVRKTANGQSVASFTIATNRVWKDQQGQKQEQAEFHNIVAWGKLADIVGQYLAKGRVCMVEGRIQTRNWTDQAGAKHWKTEIIAENVQLGPRGAGDASPSQNYDQPTYESTDNSSSSHNQSPIEEEIKVEDIPF
ncbi:MAG: single-stranded DNA-binding protein [Patescibacteria group bacterium]|jgi:single-strand DNA-binding protein